MSNCCLAVFSAAAADNNTTLKGRYLRSFLLAVTAYVVSGSVFMPSPASGMQFSLDLLAHRDIFIYAASLKVPSL